MDAAWLKLPNSFIQDSIGTETKINVLETVSTPSFRQALNIDWVSLIASCCQLKAAVVQADAKETSGHRALLNFAIPSAMPMKPC
ncbi:MAG: hypothetical protein R2857_10455 [Vampirovibrionales bacterium]